MLEGTQEIGGNKMTAITDVKLIIETLAGKTLTNAKILSIVNNYIASSAESATDAVADIDILTNEDLAQEALNMLIRSIKESVKRGAEYKARAANEAAVATASNDAIVDL